MKLLRSAQVKVQVFFEELLEIFLFHFGQRFCFVATGHLQALPIQRAGFPIENLQLARFAHRIFKTIRKAVG